VKKILLVSRGSQGDVYPYLALARALEKRGHDVLLNVPFAFEPHARALGLRYTLQGDDVQGMLNNTALGFGDLLEWTRRVIRQQFDELIPLLADRDLFIASNTEFAAPTIAEYRGLRFIRTAYAPLLPGRALMPPVLPVVTPGLLTPPALLWGVVNGGVNLMARKPLNAWRAAHGLAPIADQAEHAPSHGDNYLMYSPALGEVDPAWRYPWHIGGYCFNDVMPYDDALLFKFLSFVQRDKRPALFFTLGSINGPLHDRLAAWLLDICGRRGYKLVVGCGWWKVGRRLGSREDLFLLDGVIPHRLVLPHCRAVIHHGGSGTTHSAARAGKPQLVIPHVIDQHYWARRVKDLALGPGGVNIRTLTRAGLERRVISLMTDEVFQARARALGERLRAEAGLGNFVKYIEET